MAGVRFAPSPTGRFHVGNLRTAWVSHQIALALGEPWVVRFEDIDRERSLPGMQDLQLADLRSLGLEPARIEVQSTHEAFHRQQFDRARLEGRVYACICSRKDVAAALRGLASAPHGPEAVYSGTCRKGVGALPPQRALAWRFRVDEDSSGSSDFIVARACADGSEFVPAYHWACALDDARAGYRALVRASDLIRASVPQRRIQSWWGGTPPPIMHTSLVTAADGHRLEKRTAGVTWEELQEAGWTHLNLIRAFQRSWSPQEPFAVAALVQGRDYSEPSSVISITELLGQP